MKVLIALVVSACSIMLASVAFSESATAPQTAATAPQTTAPPTSVISTNSAAPVPLATSKRMACSGASQGLTGQDRSDRMQLCMAQARLDCLKQAIDQKIVGPERKDFVQSCIGE
jgi:uncharacterized protein YraI